MTRLLYQTNSYLQSFEATVMGLDLENNALILDQTAFYPGGGGQPADSGVLSMEDNLYRVKRARKIGPDVLHFVEPSEELPPVGTLLEGQIDWERRYQLMRTHTAMHILCGVIFRDYGAR
jgi:misacylated tRNA(Ala) deacylase